MDEVVKLTVTGLHVEDKLEKFLCLRQSLDIFRQLIVTQVDHCRASGIINTRNSLRSGFLRINPMIVGIVGIDVHDADRVVRKWNALGQMFKMAEVDERSKLLGDSHRTIQ